MSKGLLYTRLEEPNFPFDKQVSFPVDKEDPSCHFTCCKCKIVIVADPRNLPKKCKQCDSQNSFIRTDAYI